MRKSIQRASIPEELMTAIGLIWGHLNVGQFEQADKLVRGCLQVWPNDKNLLFMAAYASVELLRPLSEATINMLKNAECREWAELVLRRAEYGTEIG